MRIKAHRELELLAGQVRLSFVEERERNVRVCLCAGGTRCDLGFGILEGEWMVVEYELVRVARKPLKLPHAVPRIVLLGGDAEGTRDYAGG